MSSIDEVPEELKPYFWTREREASSLVALLHKWSVTAEGFGGHLLQSISLVKFVAS